MISHVSLGVVYIAMLRHILNSIKIAYSIHEFECVLMSLSDATNKTPHLNSGWNLDWCPMSVSMLPDNGYALYATYCYWLCS